MDSRGAEASTAISMIVSERATMPGNWILRRKEDGRNPPSEPYASPSLAVVAAAASSAADSAIASFGYSPTTVGITRGVAAAAASAAALQ